MTRVPDPPSLTRETRSPTRTRCVTAIAAPLAVLVLALVSLVGCTRVQAALAVQSDDTVAGEVVIATVGGPPIAITVPEPLAENVISSPYHQDGYQGTSLRFQDLTFDQVNSLVTVAPVANGRFRFALRRTGNLVALTGQVDLTAMPVDRADIQLKVAFPGEVVSSDGQVDGSQISWVFSPGQVNELNALVSAPDPAAPSTARWTMLVGAVVAATAIGMVLLARSRRNPPSRLSSMPEL